MKLTLFSRHLIRRPHFIILNVFIHYWYWMDNLMHCPHQCDLCIQFPTLSFIHQEPSIIHLRCTLPFWCNNVTFVPFYSLSWISFLSIIAFLMHAWTIVSCGRMSRRLYYCHVVFIVWWELVPPSYHDRREISNKNFHFRGWLHFGGEDPHGT